MNNLELINCLKTHNVVKKYFGGVFAADQLHSKIFSNIPTYIIVNTEPSSSQNGHWYVLGIGHRVIEIFDSSGKLFNKNKYLIQFLQKNIKNNTLIRYNVKQLQDESSTICGLWCCMYILHRCQNKSITSFIEQYDDSDPVNNDKKIIIQFKNNFYKCTTCMAYQSSKPFNLCN